MRRSHRPLVVISDFDLSRGEGIQDITSLTRHSAGMLSHEEDVEAEESLRLALLRQLSYYVQDHFYIPRLLISALVFLLGYLFCSLVIRDPVPMIDEIFIGGLLFVLSWVLLSRHEGNSAFALKSRIDLEKVLSSCSEVDSQFLSAAEAWIYDLEARYDLLQLSDILAGCGKTEELPPFASSEDPSKEDFIFLLRGSLLAHGEIRDYYRMVKECAKEDHALSARLVRASTVEGLDIYLIAFFKVLGL